MKASLSQSEQQVVIGYYLPIIIYMRLLLTYTGIKNPPFNNCFPQICIIQASKMNKEPYTAPFLPYILLTLPLQRNANKQCHTTVIN